MLLVKAVMAEDYDLAEQLGLLEVDAEDFALPTFVCPSKTFVCPSKMEMTDIVSQGLKAYAKEVLQ
jgi:Na+-transporting NADH:ubiquinone oxidoreductase subunit A